MHYWCWCQGSISWGKKGSKVFHLKKVSRLKNFFNNRFLNSLDGKAFEGYRCAQCPKGWEKRLIIGHG